jgi:hypothetical protein
VWLNAVYYFFTRTLNSQSAIWPCIYLFFKWKPSQEIRASQHFGSQILDYLEDEESIKNAHGISLADDELIHEALVQHSDVIADRMQSSDSDFQIIPNANFVRIDRAPSNNTKANSSQFSKSKGTFYQHGRDSEFLASS